MVPFRQTGLNLRFPVALTWDTLFSSNANAEATERLKRDPHDNDDVFCVLNGPPGSGKSLLANLWAHSWQAWIGFDCEWRSLLGLLPLKGGCFVIDNFKKSAHDDEILWHLYMRIQEINARLLIVCEKPPALWDNLTLPDLRTRLLASPHLTLSLPNDAQLGAFLLQHMRAYGFDFNQAGQHRYESISRYCLERVPRSYAAITHLARLMHDIALEKHSDLSVPLARRALHHLTEGELLSKDADSRLIG